MKNQLLQSITYDPVVLGYDDSFFKTLSGTPSVSSNLLRFNNATASSYWCFRYGSFRAKLTFPVAPTAGQDKKIGLIIAATSEGAYFNVSGATISAKTTDENGSTTTTTITWNTDWNATATLFEIIWVKDVVQFLIAGTKVAEHTHYAGQKIPKNSASIRVVNGNADNFDVTFFEIKNPESVFNPANKFNAEVTLDASDIEIGAVELKNASTDDRASIEAANTARTTATKVLAVQHVAANGSPQPSGVVADPIYVKDTSTGTDVVVLNATGAVALNATTAIAAEFRLIQVTCHFSAAPTTSENFVVKLDATAGATYDTTLFTTNPSLSAATDLVFIPDSDLKFKSGDEIVVTFTNTDTRTYGLSVYYQLI